jgi:hypothetical protein
MTEETKNETLLNKEEAVKVEEVGEIIDINSLHPGDIIRVPIRMDDPDYDRIGVIMGDRELYIGLLTLSPLCNKLHPNFEYGKIIGHITEYDQLVPLIRPRGTSCQ